MQESTRKSRRTKIPVQTREEVLRESGYMCANPGCRHILTLELHHIVWVKDGGGDEPTNLIALCPNCHSLHTHGHIPHDAIRHWKGILHAFNYAFSKESMDLLLYLSAAASHDIWYSGDGVLKFAGLIASGFAEITATVVGRGLSYGKSVLFSTQATPPSSTHRVALTDKGTSFVKAWIAGDEVALRAVLSS